MQEHHHAQIQQAHATERQIQSLQRMILDARRRFQIEAPPWRDGYPWITQWQEEIRPGRGNDMTTVYMDGERILFIQLDVYGNGHGMSVGDIEWTHSDAYEDCPCDYCHAERSAGF